MSVSFLVDLAACSMRTNARRTAAAAPVVETLILENVYRQEGD